MERIDHLDWNDLKYFLAVVRSGGLSGAAQALGGSASTVSRHIDALETHLGVRLFLRQQRGYQLTDQGSALMRHVLDVEAAMQAVERTGEALGGSTVAGPIKLAASETFAHHLLAPALPAFVARYPDARVELLIGRDLADLARREADLAVRIINPDTHEHGSDYIAQRLGSIRFAFYAAPETLARFGRNDLPLIGWDRSWGLQAIDQWLATTFGQREPVLRSNSLQAQYMATRAGLGGAVLPCYVGDADAGLQRICAAELNSKRELWTVYHRDLKASQRVRAMRDFIADLARDSGFIE
ncbi:LysR family transcriptional regulator [Chitinibacteraceae bacterium HSL-7]